MIAGLTAQGIVRCIRAFISLIIRYAFAEHYLRLPVHVITMTTNETEYEDGLRMFETSFNRTRDVDTPMTMEVIQTTKEKFWEYGWRSKIMYVLPSLR